MSNPLLSLKSDYESIFKTSKAFDPPNLDTGGGGTGYPSEYDGYQYEYQIQNGGYSYQYQYQYQGQGGGYTYEYQGQGGYAYQYEYEYEGQYDYEYQAQYQDEGYAYQLQFEYSGQTPGYDYQYQYEYQSQVPSYDYQYEYQSQCTGGDLPVECKPEGTSSTGWRCLECNACGECGGGIECPPGNTAACDAGPTIGPTVAPTPLPGVPVLTSSPNPSGVGQTVNFRATISGTCGTNNVIILYEASAERGRATMNGGIVTIPLSTLPAGNHLMHVVTQKTGACNGKVSNTVNQRVGTTSTSRITITSSKNPSDVGDTVTFTGIAPTCVGNWWQWFVNNLYATFSTNPPPVIYNRTFTTPGTYPIFLQGWNRGTIACRTLPEGRSNVINQVVRPAVATPTPPGATYSIFGNVFIDSNGNKIKDSGEANYTGDSSSFTINDTYTNTTSGVYTRSGLAPGTYVVSYNSRPTGYQMVHPLGTPPSFQVTIGPACNVADPSTGGTCSGGDVVNLNFAITNSVSWMQTYDLDLRFEDGFTNTIPPAPSYPAFASAVDSFSNTPGIIHTGNVPSNFGQGQASTTNWIVGGPIYPDIFSAPYGSRLRTSYEYLLDNSERTDIEPTNMSDLSVCGVGGISNCTLNPGLANGIYKADGDLKLNTHTFNANKDYVFLVDGDLTITGNIAVSNGVVLFASRKDIIVNRSIGAATNSFPRPSGQIQGFYISGADFIIDGINDCSTGKDKMLNIEGAIVINASGAGGAFVNRRDLCGDNASIPSLTVSPRLDFILNAPAFLLQPDTISREEAP